MCCVLRLSVLNLARNQGVGCLAFLYAIIECILHLKYFRQSILKSNNSSTAVSYLHLNKCKFCSIASDFASKSTIITYYGIFLTPKMIRRGGKPSSAANWIIGGAKGKKIAGRDWREKYKPVVGNIFYYLIQNHALTKHQIFTTTIHKHTLLATLVQGINYENDLCFNKLLNKMQLLKSWCT